MADTQNWRDWVKVHPAADMFPMMSEAELDELGKDIAANGLRQSPVVYHEGETTWLLDGRNRLEAMQRAGIEPPTRMGCLKDIDPYVYVISANIQRRHLTTEQRKELAAKLLAANPAKSDREIAKQVKVDHKTIAKVRTEKETSGEIPRSEKRGRQKAPEPKSEIQGSPVDPANDYSKPVNEDAVMALRKLFERISDLCRIDSRQPRAKHDTIAKLQPLA
jgi:hypothetical protein